MRSSERERNSCNSARGRAASFHRHLSHQVELQREGLAGPGVDEPLPSCGELSGGPPGALRRAEQPGGDGQLEDGVAEPLELVEVPRGSVGLVAEGPVGQRGQQQVTVPEAVPERLLNGGERVL